MSDETPNTTDAARSERERLRWGRGLLVLLSIVLSIVALGAAAVFVVSSTDYGHERVRRFALKQIESKAHGVVRIGRVTGNLLRGLTLHDVAITDSAGAPFFAADSVSAGYSLRPFLSKHVVLRDVVLSRPVVVLDKPPGGAWNWERIFPGDTTAKQDTVPGWGSWLRFENVRVADGRLIVRTPWHPDTTLAPSKVDSVVRVALAGGTRLEVARVPGGFQKTSDFRDIYGRFPLIRLADPSTKVRRIEVATARAIALPFRPPAADVRDVNGVFELTSDSLWFSGVRASFPGSRLVNGAGSYLYDSGDLRLAARGAPASFGDFRWAYPRFPAAGGGTLDFAMALLAEDYDFSIRRADVNVGQSHLAGDLGFRIVKAVTFHDTDLRFERFDTRLLEQLVPNLHNPRNGLATGRLAMAGGFDSLTVNGDVAFADPSYGTSRIVAAGMFGYDTVPGGKVLLRARDLRLQLAPFQVAMARAFDPTLPVAGTLVGTATLDGSTATRVVAVTDRRHDDRGLRSHVSGRSELRFARAGAAPTWADVNLRLAPLSLAEVGRFAPAAGLHGSAAGPVRVTGSLGNLRLDAPLDLNTDGTRGGMLTVRGTLDLASAQKGYDIAAAAELFDAHAVVTKAPETSLTMTASARGRGFDPATMRATFAADMQTSSYDSIPVDSARLRVRIADGLLTSDSTMFYGSAARAVVNGSFGLAKGREGTLAYTVQADSLRAFARLLPKADTTAVPPRPRRAARALARARADSAQIAEHEAVERAATGQVAVRRRERVAAADTAAVRADSLAGALYAAGVVRGGLQRFDLRGRAGVSDLVAFGSSVRRGRLEYGWTGARTPASAFAVGAQLDSASVSGFSLDSVDARATYRNNTGNVAVVVQQETDRAYSLVADYAIHPDHKELHWRDATMRLDTTRWVTTRPGAVRWGARGIEIETLEMRSGPVGRIYVNGLLPTEGEGDLQVAIDNFQVGDLVALAQSDLEARGRVSLGLTFQGTMSRPRFKGALGVVDGNYRGTFLPDVRSTFAYDHRRLEATAQLLREGGAPMATATGSLPVNLALSGVTGPRLRQNARLALDVTADSLPLEVIPRLTDAIADTRGLAQGTVRVRGTVHEPKMAGAFAVSNGQVRVVPAGITLRQVAGTVHLAGDTVVIDSLVGYSGGRVLLRGGLGVKSLAAPSFALNLVANDVRVLSNERGRITLNAGLALTGPFDNAYVSGAIKNVHGVFYLPEASGKTVINAGDPAVFNVIDTSITANKELLPAQSPLLANLRADVDVEIAHDMWVRNQDANVEVFTDGPLRLNVDRRNQALTVFGVVSTERGQYTFLSKRFEIRRGSASFIGLPDINPTLQLTGEYEVRLPAQQAFSIQVLIGGTVQNPRITLQSDRQPPISQSDLLSYLAFGRSSSSLLQIEGSSLSGSSGASGNLVGAGASLATTRLAAVALGVAVDQLETGAARSLGADVLNITPADVNTELARGNVASFLQGTEIEFGRYLSGSKVYLALQGRPTYTAPPGARFEYRAQRGFRYQASYEPRFILSDPTLGPQADAPPVGVFGLFVIREWRF